jgi:hypothetical protein
MEYHMTDLSDVTGSITTIAGLGLTLGALGLAFNFADKAARGFQESPKKRRQQQDMFNFDYDFMPKKKSRKQEMDIFSWSY